MSEGVIQIDDFGTEYEVRSDHDTVLPKLRHPIIAHYHMLFGHKDDTTWTHNQDKWVLHGKDSNDVHQLYVLEEVSSNKFVTTGETYRTNGHSISFFIDYCRNIYVNDKGEQMVVIYDHLDMPDEDRYIYEKYILQ